MKRRVLLAVLLVLALVVAGVALIGDTGQREPEATKGKPWIGSSGVTRSVAGIAARQKFLQRHPSARPVTDEGEAEAEGEGGPAQAAAETVGGVRIREKPEPGEEGNPSRRPGPATRQTRVGEAAITPSQAVTPSSTNFLGAQSNESGFVPPDSMGAVGPSQVVVFVNGRLKVWDRQGTSTALSVSDSAFWAPVRNGTEPTDPGVEYDRLSQRWILSAINTESTNNRVMLAVSDGPTINSTSDFTFFFFNEATPPPAGPARFADYPQLAVDANAIYIGVNEFTSSSGSFSGTSAYVIRKSSVLGAGPIVVTAFRNLVSSISAPGPDSPQPATNLDPSATAGYIVGPDNQFFSLLDVRRISDPGGTPSISGNLTVSVPTTTSPLSVPAQGTSGGLDALDDRLFEAMIGRDPSGAVSLWTAQNIQVNSSGQGSNAGGRDGGRWYQLGTLDTTPSLVQSGTLFDSAPSNPRYFWIPSIAMNGQGHASLNASTAGVGRFAEVASSGRLFTDPLGTTEAPQITQTSTSTYNLGSDSPRRWGDYSQTVVDPTDNMTFWTFQEYANANNSWGVRVIKLQAPPPATPSTATPSTAPLGQCSVSANVAGTSTDGSGFFDPGADPGGPGYASHITASATGGVAVNGVTYVDPTHVTLDLDTRSAASGAQDVTITNPDGQSVTATGLITIDTPASGPTTPCLNGTTPDSPANENQPEIFGSADAGSTVDLYTSADCTGTPVGTGSASAFAAPGIPVDPVPDNSSTTYYATATDSGSNVSACSSTLGTASGSETYVEDSTSPVPTVDSGPGLTNDSTPTFSFSATDASTPIDFQCSIDTGTPSFGACSGPGNSDTPASPLADGIYTFRVQATDPAGNSAIATRSFQIDATPPSVSVDSGPTGTIATTTPTFTFSATDAVGPITFNCSIDTGAPSFGACSGPGNSDTPPAALPDGGYAFRVRATDGAGNPATATRAFTVQTPQPPAAAAPDTSITKGPKKTRKRKPKFTFTSSQVGSTFQCQLDKGAFTRCTSPFVPSAKLRPGKHVLKVQAIGPTGIADGTPAVKKFKVIG